MTPADQNLRFGPGGRFELQPLERRLLVDGEPATLGARAFDLLLELATRPGRLQTKNELIEAVWPGVVVEEGNLATQISTLRKVLGGDVIVTIPGRGYRFAAPIERAAAAPAGPDPAAPAAAPPEFARLQTNLPDRLPHLIGRTDDLAALNELVDRHALVSIIGAGGMGKTTLALHLTAARQAAYRHGVCWVELATVTDPAALPSAIAAAIGVRIGSGDPLAGLCAALRPLAMLVVLDNAEQVVDGVARVVQAVLDKAPAVQFVVTTQVPLKLPAERAYRIGALAVPQGPLAAAQALEFDAIALFVERAQAADARFVLGDANAAVVIDLCRELDGVPLAIELAAARAPMLGVQRLAASMGDRLRLLTSSRNRIAPARQQTLRAALEWSHGFLDETERTVFRRLSVFAGSASLTMIQRVVADPPGEGDLDPWAVLDALALLVDRSLAIAMTSDDATEPRYRLLETPRLFAREQLQQAGEADALRRRHAHAVAAYFDGEHEAYEYQPTGTWRKAMEPDLDNGREALAWALAAGDAVRSAQIAVAVSRVIGSGGYREQLAMAEAIEPLIDGVDDAGLLARLALLLVGSVGEDRQRARALVYRVVARMPPRSPGDPDGVRWAHHRALTAIADVEARCGNLAQAEAALVQARELVDPAWPPGRMWGLVQVEGACAQVRGDLAASLMWTRREIELARTWGASIEGSLANLVDAELAVGDVAQAVATGTALVASLADGRNERMLALARVNLAAALLSSDRRDLAEPHLRAGWAEAPTLNLHAFFADYLALFAALDGRGAAAARLAGYADAANARVGERQANEAAAIARATQLARGALGTDAFDRLHEEGVRLRDAEVEALAFAPPPAAP